MSHGIGLPAASLAPVPPPSWEQWAWWLGCFAIVVLGWAAVVVWFERRRTRRLIARL